MNHKSALMLPVLILIFCCIIITLVLIPARVTPTAPVVVIPTPTAAVAKYAISESNAISLVAALPEVKKEIAFLESNGSKSTLYVEIPPNPDNQFYHLYFGELKEDHENRIVSFEVDANNGQISIDDIVTSQKLTYYVWSQTCKIAGCSPQDTGYSKADCPKNGWVDCMPQINSSKNKFCQSSFLQWAKTNCPNFHGAAM